MGGPARKCRGVAEMTATPRPDRLFPCRTPVRAPHSRWIFSSGMKAWKTKAKVRSWTSSTHSPPFSRSTTRLPTSRPSATVPASRAELRPADAILQASFSPFVCPLIRENRSRAIEAPFAWERRRPSGLARSAKRMRAGGTPAHPGTCGKHRTPSTDSHGQTGSYRASRFPPRSRRPRRHPRRSSPPVGVASAQDSRGRDAGSGCFLVLANLLQPLLDGRARGEALELAAQESLHRPALPRGARGEPVPYFFRNAPYGDLHRHDRHYAPTASGRQSARPGVRSRKAATPATDTGP